MKQKSIIFKIAIDMLKEQLKWSIWFITIIIILHIVGTIFSSKLDFDMNNLYGFSYYSSPVYMLVIGIIAGSIFLPFYIKHGVTRKDYYIGSVIGTFGLAIAFAIIFGVISGIEEAIFGLFDIQFTNDPIITNMNSNLFGMLVAYILNVFAYYLIGWLINVGFYRFGWMVGLGFIALSIIIASVHGFIWGEAVALPWMELFNLEAKYTVLFSIVGTILLIGIMLYSIRLITKKVAIKI